MPNMLAYAAMLSAPVAIFFLFRYLPIPNAIIAGTLASYLLLPMGVSFDYPMLPELDKVTLPAVFMLIVCAMALARSRVIAARPAAARPRNWMPVEALPGWLPRSRLILALLAMVIVSRFGAVFTNGDTFSVGPRVLAGLRPYDLLNVLGIVALQLVTFLLARRFLGHREGQAALLAGLGVAGFLYCLPALLEVRIAPQLHAQIYGFMQHSFVQHIRDGGFRPLVFLEHGLWVGIFFAMALLAAVGVMGSRRGTARAAWIFAAAFIGVTLFLSKTFGALLIALVLLPAAVFLSPRWKLLVAGAAVALVMSYPLVRGMGLFPTNAIVQMAQTVHPGRAASVAYRFQNEEVYLEKLNQKPVFGWAGWGRGELYDPVFGAKMSTSDGAWIIFVRDFGWVGYIGVMGLLGLPLVVLAFRRRDLSPTPEEAALGLVMTANLLDMLLNGTVTPVTWLIAGALAGSLERAPAPAAVPERGLGLLRRRTRKAEPVAVAADAAEEAETAGSRYTRQTRRHVRGGPPVRTTHSPAR